MIVYGEAEDDKENDIDNQSLLLKNNEDKLEQFRKYMFNSNDHTQINLLDNIINIISGINNEDIRLVNEGECNDTLDCSKPSEYSKSVLCSNYDSESNNISINVEGNYQVNQNDAKQSRFYRGIPLKDERSVKQTNYENDDSFVEDN